MTRQSEWWKIALVWVIGFLERIQENSAHVLFWLGAIYTVLNIVALIRREFLKDRHHGPTV